MESFILKKATILDLKDIQNISIETFVSTFSDVNTPQNMQNYIETAFNDSQLTSEINNPATAFYLALYEDLVVGYLKINFNGAQTEESYPNSLEIHRIYVHEDFHGKKVGQFLLNKALDIGKEKQFKNIWLGVWEKNFRAQAFYSKNNFEKIAEHPFVLGDEKQIDYIMSLNL